MKITGGLAKGIPIKSSNKSTLRPATDYLRQAIFSSLGSLVENAYFLDLFAGTGSYGLEAWSRGASGGIFIEKDRQLIPNILSNIEAAAKSMNANPQECKVIQSDVFKIPLHPENQFDLIFCDPPYEIIEDVIENLLELSINYLSKKLTSRLIIEVPGHFIPPDHANFAFAKKIGKNSKNSPAAFICELKNMPKGSPIEDL